MFKYTNFSEVPNQRVSSSKTQIRSSSLQKPRGTSPRLISESHSSKPSTPQKDKALSERYTNRTYNRLPSPKGKFQSLDMKDRPPFVVSTKPSTVDEEWSKPSGGFWEKPPKPMPRSVPVKQSCSDIVNRRRTLEMECNKSSLQPDVDVKVRPKTSQCSRAESRLENKVLNTVQNVLSRALLQQGKIDETNIAIVINSMRHSLYLEKNLDDEDEREINVESKQSRTTVNECSVEDHSISTKSRPKAGIVRRDNPISSPDRKPYRKIYHQTESSSMGRNTYESDEKTFVSVDVPGLVLPNLPTNKNTDGKTDGRSTVEADASKHNIHLKSSKKDKRDFMKQFEVGDSQTKHNHFWNASEDAKLREYVESLIHNMKGQVTFDTSVTNTEGEIDSQGTICRSLCVCKVCCSKQDTFKVDEPSSLVHNERPKSPETPDLQETKQQNRGPGSRLRLVKQSPKGTKLNSQCKFIKKTNSNFQPESSLNTSLNKKTSYTVVDENLPEEGDDMYFQQRIRRTTSRRGSAKINY